MRLRARSGSHRIHGKGFGIAKTFAIHKNSGHLHFPMSHFPECYPSLSRENPPKHLATDTPAGRAEAGDGLLHDVSMEL